MNLQEKKFENKSLSISLIEFEPNEADTSAAAGLSESDIFLQFSNETLQSFLLEDKENLNT